MDGRRALEMNMSEDDLMSFVIDLAHLHGWLVHHTRPAKTAKGWRTPIQGDAGFPDLVLARDGIAIFAELKSEKGRVSREQRTWHDALPWRVHVPIANGQELHPVVQVWRPSDRADIEKILSNQRRGVIS